MPNQDIKSVIDTKPVTFTLKTGGGKWKCTLHGDRHGYEKHRNANGDLARTDSDMSASSSKTTSSAGSVSSTH
ncbi:Exocyst complex component S5 [Pestalotiopsis sp. IQ-011]